MAGDADDNKESSGGTTSTDQLRRKGQIAMAAELALVKYAFALLCIDVRSKERRGEDLI